MINQIRKEMEKYKGKVITIKVDMGRNKREKYKGKVINLYSRTWIFETNDGIKSFTYSDIITKTVKISP